MLLTYNPNQTGLPLGRTTLKALTGPGAAFPDQGLRRFHDFESIPAATLLVVEVDKRFATQWTKPEDLMLTEDAA